MNGDAIIDAVDARPTPLQRACLHLAGALEAAREDERADEMFVDLLCRIAAREAARRLERERRAI